MLIARLAISLILMFISACGSDSATVGGPEPVTASGTLAVSGVSASALAASGKISPTVGAEIINATNPYTLKFDDTLQAINVLYTETGTPTVYTLSISSIGVTSAGVPYGSSFEVISTGTQITGVSVDKANKSITFTQVLLPESNGGVGNIIVDGRLQVL